MSQILDSSLQSCRMKESKGVGFFQDSLFSSLGKVPGSSDFSLLSNRIDSLEAKVDKLLLIEDRRKLRRELNLLISGGYLPLEVDRLMSY